MRNLVFSFGLVIFHVLLGSTASAQEILVRVRTDKNLIQIPKETVQVLYNAEIQKNIEWQWVKNKRQSYDIVKLIPLTDYLAGVVSKEMPLSWPLEALKAQAVVARSYVLYQMVKRQNIYFDVDADQMDQVFSFTRNAKAYQAVGESLNTVVKDFSGHVIKAYYHSDCGGHTLPASQVWPGSLDTGTAEDSWCQARIKNQWQTVIPWKNFETETEAKLTDGIKTERLQNKIISVAEVSIQKLRQVFGYDKIRSSPSKIQIDENGVHFHGAGYGHGVGLCQWGARSQAILGKTYVEILKHYYPKATIWSGTSSGTKVAKTDSSSKLIFN